MTDNPNVFDFPKPQEPQARLLALSDMPEEEPLKPWYSGFPEWRSKMALAPGTLSVCTGHPGNGKSTLMGNIWFNTASINDLGVVVATFETRPLPHYRKMLRQFWSGMPQHQMSDQEIAAADEFIEDHYRFIVHSRQRPNITEIIDLAAKAGHCQVVVIDPWNRLESQRNKNETETEYIAWCLSELRLFAVQYNCHVQIIAHPAKRDIRYRDEFPILEDISGSKHWDNLPDQGFCVHRPAFVDEDGNRRWDAELHHLKSRFEELGYPCTFDLRLNPKTWRFETFNKPKKKPKRGDTSV